MPIKQLQLRGISRTPSDRASADGGCAESLNVHLDQGETAPTMPPQEKDVYGNAQYKFPIVYIHKMLNATIYIGLNVGENDGVSQYRAYGTALGDNNGAILGTFSGYDSSEWLTHITSVGNTLIIYTNKKPRFLVFKENAYHNLGSTIPRPQVDVITKHYEGSDPTYVYSKIAKELRMLPIDSTKWTDAVSPDGKYHDDLMETMTEAWDTVTQFTGNWRQKGYFAAPFFIRYALRLYDGSYVHSSAPILCGTGAGAEWVKMKIGPWNTDSGIANSVDVFDDYAGYVLEITLANIYRVHIKTGFTVGNWGDIVKSIDIFASTPIYTPAWEVGVNAIVYTGDSNPHTDFTLDGMDAENRDRTVREEVLSKGQFYKIMSIAVDDTEIMRKFRDGYLTINASDDVSGDKLATHDNMPDPYRDGNQYMPVADAQNYNHRLLLLGGEEMLSRGDEFLNGLCTGPGLATYKTRRYGFRFKLVDPLTGDAHYFNGHYTGGTNYFFPGCIRHKSGEAHEDVQYFGKWVTTLSGATYYPSDPWSWIAYPDTRCKEVEVFFYDNSGNYVDSRIVPMEPHPLLECSFAFLGLDNALTSLINNSAYTQGAETDISGAEDLRVTAANKVFLSEFENPFVFTASGITTMPDIVVGGATTSVPLSEGQVGDFPMYVFTEGGIRVLVTNAEGTFAANMTPPNLSRHVALPKSILGIEQSVVFSTAKGVMMLTGSNVVELSRVMNGMPYSITGDIAVGSSTILDGTGWSGLLNAASAGETLMGFMDGASPAYDHSGARLIFFKPGKSYQYVYMLETQSWHKMETGIDAGRILNSYPDCLVSNKVGTVGKVWNFTTVLNNASLLSRTANPVKGIIVTRPFDLGEPDIRKAIRSIRVRGNYNRDNVKYILLGSFDGINWQRLTSLRGGSYKQFRMILLTDLTATERITWIDVDYETRFTNRLR